jgi:opacity protein-like surface antigen
MARADGYINPWAGVNFGNDFSDARGAFGVNAGAMGAGVIGGEVAFGYSPDFFGPSGDFGSNKVIDLMGNLIIGIPLGGQHGAGFRPYVTGGVGLIRTQFDSGPLLDISVANNDFGWNLGAGVMGYFNDHVGVRADVRYLRNFSGDSLDTLDIGTFHFWRAALGLVIR